MKDIKDVIFGAIYTADPKSLSKWEHVNRDYPWDQRYEYWIPAVANGNIYMVNTYQIENVPHGVTQESFEKIADIFAGAGDGGSSIVHSSSGYYYQSRTKLSEENVGLFEFVADLRDYKVISEREANDYLEEDILENVRLYHEHAYPYGITLVKKNAVKNVSKQITAIIWEVMNKSSKPSVAWTYDSKRFQELLAVDNGSYDQETVNAFLEYVNTLKRMHDEFVPIAARLGKAIY